MARHALRPLLVQIRTRSSAELRGKKLHLPVQFLVKPTVIAKLGAVTVILLAQRQRPFTVEVHLTTLPPSVWILVLLGQTRTARTESNASSILHAMTFVRILLTSLSSLLPLKTLSSVAKTSLTLLLDAIFRVLRVLQQSAPSAKPAMIHHAMGATLSSAESRGMKPPANVKWPVHLG